MKRAARFPLVAQFVGIRASNADGLQRPILARGGRAEAAPTVTVADGGTLVDRTELDSLSREGEPTCGERGIGLMVGSDATLAFEVGLHAVGP